MLHGQQHIPDRIPLGWCFRYCLGRVAGVAASLVNGEEERGMELDSLESIHHFVLD